MKRKLTTILAVEALALVAFCIFRPYFGHSFTTIMAFPFEQIGKGLREISLFSMAGNIISFIIYSVICLLPGIYLVLRLFKNKANGEDGLLALLSIVLFFVMYLMINPADIARHFGSFELLEANKAFLGVIIYSIIAGYLILRIMRIFVHSETGSILKYLLLLLAAICMILIYGIFGSSLIGLVSAFKQLSIDNTVPGQNLSLSYLFLLLQYFVNILPFILQIAIIYAGLDLMEALKQGPYCKDTAVTAQKTGQICRRSVAVIMLSQISINVLQLILGSSIHSSHYTLSIPLLSVMFVLIAMLLAGYFEQAYQLKIDNEMFI